MSSSEENAVKLWEQCCPRLRALLSENVFNMFLGAGNAFPVALSERELTLGFPPNAYLDWIENYRPDVEAVLKELTGRGVKASFQLLGEDEYARLSPHVQPKPEVRAAPSPKPPAAGPSHDPRLESLNSNYTFDSFVVGSNTSFAYKACRQVASAPGQSCNPLFIHGPSGVGKTHLMQAIAREVCLRNPKATVEYLTSEHFGNLYVEACTNKLNGNMADFRRRFRNVDVLLIDDVQFFKNKEGMQEEFFHTFEELYNDHKQIVLASDRIPEELDGLSARLISRFAWGVTVDITLPDLTTRMAILNEKQLNSPVKLPPPIIEYLASRVRSNVRTLESCLRILQAFLSLSGNAEPVSRSLVDELCSSHFEQDAAVQVTMARVQEVVAHYFDVRVQEMRGKSRQAEITQARQVAMYLSRELTGKSLPAIALAFEKTHPTVLHSIRTIEKRLGKSPELQQTINDIARKITSE